MKLKNFVKNVRNVSESEKQTKRVVRAGVYPLTSPTHELIESIQALDVSSEIKLNATNFLIFRWL